MDPDEVVEEAEETGDPCVPSDLLELHVSLEESGTTAEAFKEMFANDSDH